MKKLIEKIKSERIIKSLFNSLFIGEDFHDTQFHTVDTNEMIIWIGKSNNTLFICPNEVETLIGTQYNRYVHDAIVNYLNPYNNYKDMICFQPMGKTNYEHITFDEYEEINREDKVKSYIERFRY